MEEPLLRPTTSKPIKSPSVFAGELFHDAHRVESKRRGRHGFDKLNASRRALCDSIRLGLFAACTRKVMPLAAAAILIPEPSRSETTSPQREKTSLEIEISADNDVNPDEKLRATPILLHMFELRSSVAFESADFFSLNSNDRTVLGRDMLTREEYVLRPGERRLVRRKSHPDVEALGWIAGYRNLALSDWRAVLPVEVAPESAWYRAPLPANKVKVAVCLQRQGIRVVHGG